jgi:hypothetical protein
LEDIRIKPLLQNKGADNPNGIVNSGRSKAASSRSTSGKAGKTISLQGTVSDRDGGPVVDANIELEVVPGLSYKATTDSHGGFNIQGIRARVGDGARIFISKDGRSLHNEYVTLPLPLAH